MSTLSGGFLESLQIHQKDLIHRFGELDNVAERLLQLRCGLTKEASRLALVGNGGLAMLGAKLSPVSQLFAASGRFGGQAAKIAPWQSVSARDADGQLSVGDRHVLTRDGLMAMMTFREGLIRVGFAIKFALNLKA